MRTAGFWVLLLLAKAAALMFLSLDGPFAQDTSKDDVEAKTPITEAKEGSDTQKIKTDKINIEDYGKIDPAPSSSAAVTSGPIEYGTPLMPYIPKPTPPYHPWHGGSSGLPSPA